MVEQYLENKYIDSNALSNVRKIVKGQLQEVSNKISGKYRNNLKISDNPQYFSEFIIKELQKLDPSNIEFNIRQSKIIEAKRQKKELEAKLKFITSSIDYLDPIIKLPQNLKPNLQKSENRHQFFDQEKEKIKSLKKTLKKYSKQQKDQQEKLEKKLQDLEKQQELEKKREQEEKLRKLEEKNKAYQEYLQRIKEKAENRKQELKQNFAMSLKAINKEKPLFIQLSERYVKEVEMPELEKRKRELSEKRIMNSYSTKAVMDHARWYESVKNEIVKKRPRLDEIDSVSKKSYKSVLSPSAWYERVEEEERRKMEEKVKKEKEFMQRLDKRDQYASLIKELYSPSVSSKIKEKPNSENMKKNLSKSQEKAPWKPHIFKPNPLIPLPPGKKSMESPDYLRLLREERENKEENEDMQVKNPEENPPLDPPPEIILPSTVKASITKKTKQFDEEIRKKELKISCSPKINLKLSQEVNQMYLSSIKAKLSFLDLNNN